MIIIFMVMIMSVLVFTVIRENKETKKAIEEYRSTEGYLLEESYSSEPSDISPAMVNLIVNQGKVSSGMLFVTLFYLAQKGYYKIEELKIYEKRKVKSDLRFTRNIDILMPREAHLRFIIEIFKEYESNHSFTMVELEEIFKKYSIVRSFREKLMFWRDEIEKEAYDTGIITEINDKRILTNYYNNEREKWCLYRVYLRELIEAHISDEILEKSEMLLVYAVALNIDLTETNSKLLQKESYEKNNDCYSNSIYHRNYSMIFPLYNNLYYDVQDRFMPANTSDLFGDIAFDGGNY